MKTVVIALVLACAAVLSGSYGYGQTIVVSEGNHEGILVPDSFGKLAEIQISRMYRDGYFNSLDVNDFDHGHLILPVGLPDEFSSIEEVFSYATFTLYHTHERDLAWKSQEPLDPGKRQQRSIVGLSDGGVRPAIEFFSVRYEEFSHYISNGTVHATDFGLFMPKQFEQDRDGICIVFRTGTQLFRNQFIVYQVAAGRYEVAGVRYDIYLEFR